MPPIQIDGLAVLPELTDDAILVSNLLDRPVLGRENISRIIRALENHYVSISDIERINTASHRVIESRALLPSGDRVKITIVGTRDDHGWISEVVLTAHSDRPLDELSAIMKCALD